MITIDRLKMLGLGLLASVAVFAQVPSREEKVMTDALASVPLDICYDKTLHLIFPSQVRYVRAGSAMIMAETVDQDGRVVRVKSAQEEFRGETNLTVICSDGGFYSYDVRGCEDVGITCLIIGRETGSGPRTFQVSDNKALHLVFPSDIVYADLGSEFILASMAPGARNILAITAQRSFIPVSNVSVITKDGSFYTFDLVYDGNPAISSYVITTPGQNRDSKMRSTPAFAILDKADDMQQDSLRRIFSQAPQQITISRSSSGVSLTLRNIFIWNSMLYFSMEMENMSSIPYTLDFVRFWIEDRKSRRRTATSQEEIIPENTIDIPRRDIASGERCVFTSALRKFTIPDGKILIIEVQEKGGGRHFQLRIPNRTIMRARPISSLHSPGGQNDSKDGREKVQDKGKNKLKKKSRKRNEKEYEGKSRLLEKLRRKKSNGQYEGKMSAEEFVRQAQRPAVYPGDSLIFPVGPEEER